MLQRRDGGFPMYPLHISPVVSFLGDCDTLVRSVVLCKQQDYSFDLDSLAPPTKVPSLFQDPTLYSVVMAPYLPLAYTSFSTSSGFHDLVTFASTGCDSHQGGCHLIWVCWFCHD